MGFFTRTADHVLLTEDAARRLDAGATSARIRARAYPSALRADGYKIKPMSALQLRAAVGHKQAWQSLAWGYRDMIGELRFALRFRSAALSRARLYPAMIVDDDDEPLALSLRHDTDSDGAPSERSRRITLPADLCAAAEEELSRLPLSDGQGFLGIWSENFDVAGECWLHGWTDPTTGEPRYQIRSVDDVDIQGDSMTVRDPLGQPRKVDLDVEELYRFWVPHPRQPHLADSSLNSLLDVLEDISLIGRELRAAARSRIASNGVLFLPKEMAVPRNIDKDSDRSPEDQFLDEFTAAWLAPIANEGDSGAVVPLLVLAREQAISAVRYMRLERETSPELLTKLEKSLGRLGTSLDIPPEILTGLAEVNHWTAWAIDNATFRSYLEPSLRLMADSLTTSYLRETLIFRGFPPEQVSRVRVWYDASGMTENPNRRQDAIDARDRAAISDDTFRRALGFNEGDAPSAEEQILMVAAKVGIDQATAAALLSRAATDEGADLPEPEQTRQADTTRPTGTPTIAPGDSSAPGGTGAPSTAPPGIVAAAAPRARYTLEVETARALMDIDRALRDRVLHAADAALSRALEKSGSRLRSKATRNPAIAASMKNVPVASWAQIMGREATFALADLPHLLREAWDDLRVKFGQWVSHAINSVIDRVLASLRVDPTSRTGRAYTERMRQGMESRVDTAWAGFQSGLDALAEDLMFRSSAAPEERGEHPDVQVPPHLVRTALAVIGGTPETSSGHDQGRPLGGEPLTGLGDGATVDAVMDDAGAFGVGHVWVYGVTPMSRGFHPHRQLDGQRFLSWSDPVLEVEPGDEWIDTRHYHPGDHRGCMCSSARVYAVPRQRDPHADPTGGDDTEPDFGQQIRDLLSVPTAGMRDILALAADDDKAGRSRTTAQTLRAQWQAVQDMHAEFLRGSSR